MKMLCVRLNLDRMNLDSNLSEIGWFLCGCYCRCAWPKKYHENIL